MRSIKHPSTLNINRFEEYKTVLNNLMKKSETRFNDEQFKSNNSIKSSNKSAWPHKLLVCMSLRKSLTEFIWIIKSAAMMYRIYMMNGVHGPESMSSGIITSSNPQVSALIPRPAFNGIEKMCQRYGSNLNTHPPVLVRKPLCNEFIYYQISSRRVFGINHFKLRNFAVVAIIFLQQLIEAV